LKSEDSESEALEEECFEDKDIRARVGEGKNWWNSIAESESGRNAPSGRISIAYTYHLGSKTVLFLL
jgi:hypothetical protein